MELLIKWAQKGDEEAFIEAIDTLMPQMYKVAKARLKNEEDIGDAIQETILSAFTNLKKVKEPVYFKTWITKILMNKCNDIVRKNKVLYVDEKGKTYKSTLKGYSSAQDNGKVIKVKTFDVTTFDNVNHFKVLLKDIDGKDVVIDLAREEKK
ncbi:RNA polymerase sigma factor [Bacillus cereus]|uniref:RNA polymerase sigma factor n=1 Tax=Bacillus cereus TaxID=1396 RepID=UPI000BF759AE|nr:sigma-70 family RNA polymerase sigma factor [Bacillus cereus]PFA03363.1 hypothetical protein CN382_29345 [Bacillus cereus]